MVFRTVIAQLLIAVNRNRACHTVDHPCALHQTCELVQFQPAESRETIASPRTASVPTRWPDNHNQPDRVVYAASYCLVPNLGLDYAVALLCSPEVDQCKKLAERDITIESNRVVRCKIVRGFGGVRTDRPRSCQRSQPSKPSCRCSQASDTKSRHLRAQPLVERWCKSSRTSRTYCCMRSEVENGIKLFYLFYELQRLALRHWPKLRR